MQSIPPPGDPHSPRLRCAHCGLSAVIGDVAWSQFTAVSHSGSTEAAERNGHAVGMELCRRCLRSSLRNALGMPPSGPAEVDGQGTAQLHGFGGETQRMGRALRSMERTNAFIRASERRLARWREEDRQEQAGWLPGPTPAPSPGSPGGAAPQNGGSSAASSAGAAASLGATRGAPAANADNGQTTASVGSSQRSERSQSRA